MRLLAKFKQIRGGSRGRVQGVRLPPPPPPEMRPSSYFAFKICLPHWSVTSFLRGAPPSKKNPGSAPANPVHGVQSHLKFYLGCF